MRLFLFRIIIILLNFLVCVVVAEQPPEYEVLVPVESGTSETNIDAWPVLSISYVPGGYPETAMIVSVSIWQTGKAIWSTNGIRGREPYYQGKVESGQVTNVLNILRKAGIYDDPSLFDHYPGMDNEFCVATIIEGDKMLCMKSPFDFVKPIADANVKTKQYYMMWNKLTQTIRSLIPKEGTRVEYNYKVRQIKYKIRSDRGPRK